MVIFGVIVGAIYYQLKRDEHGIQNRFVFNPQFICSLFFLILSCILVCFHFLACRFNDEKSILDFQGTFGRLTFYHISQSVINFW